MPKTPQSKSFTEITLYILKQAWPILISQWAGMAFGVIDTMMLGNFSPDALQTISLAASIYITVTISLVGVVHALIPICSQLIGEGRKERVGEFWGQGFWLSWFVSLLGGILLLFPDVWLSLAGTHIPAQVRLDVTHYLQIVSLSLPAALMFRVIYSLCTASQRTKSIMYISLSSVVVKVLLNYALIFGALGIPSMGSTGAAISTAAVTWFMLLLGFYIVLRDDYYKQFSLKLSRPSWIRQKELLKLGLPMGGSYLVEISSFTFMALLAAREGTFASGAHQILANLMGILYMMPMSLGVATASLTAQALGSKQPLFANRIVLNALIISAIGACVSIIIIWVFKVNIISLYTNNFHITTLAIGLLSIIPILHFTDVMQCMNIYILRAHKIAAFPFVLQAACLLCIGLGGGYFFGYGPGQGSLYFLSDIFTPGAPYGVSSLWIMNSLGLIICAIALHIWYRRIAHASFKIN